MKAPVRNYWTGAFFLHNFFGSMLFAMVTYI